MVNAKKAAALLMLTLCPALTAAEGMPMLGVQIQDTPAPTQAAVRTPAPTAPTSESSEGGETLMAEITQAEMEAAALGTRILMRGMEGEDVALMQRRLYQLGYYLGEIDGVFGLGTRTAVYGFQRAHRLEKVDGKVGPETIARMFSDNVVVKPTPTPSPTPTPTPSPTPTATPKPTPGPSATPRVEGAPFALETGIVYIAGQKVELALGSDETGETLYPLCGVLAWLDYDSAYAAGSWQFVHRNTGDEIALMTDGRDGLCAGAMGSSGGVIFLADEESRVYVYGEEAYVTQALLSQLGVDVLLVEGVPVLERR